MANLQKEIMTDETHKESNCVMITIICHGNRKGELLNRYMKKGWILEDFVAKLSDVPSLLGKPKIMLVQACRGCEHFNHLGHTWAKVFLQLLSDFHSLCLVNYVPYNNIKLYKCHRTEYDFVIFHLWN